MSPGSETKGTEMAPAFEHRSCGRCGGSGQYFHYGACFRCGGAGNILTKRGAAANALYTEMAKIPARDVQVGQFIETIIGIPYPTVRYGFRPVVEISHEVAEGASLIDGEMKPYRKGVVVLVTAKEKDGSGIGCAAHHSYGESVRIALSGEAKKANIAKCLEYQATLTASGTPRKRVAA